MQEIRRKKIRMKKTLYIIRDIAITAGIQLVCFMVSLHDEKGPVGGGVHERFVVNDAKFAAKAESKKG